MLVADEPFVLTSVCCCSAASIACVKDQMPDAKRPSNLTIARYGEDNESTLELTAKFAKEVHSVEKVHPVIPNWVPLITERNCSDSQFKQRAHNTTQAKS